MRGAVFDRENTHNSIMSPTDVSLSTKQKEDKGNERVSYFLSGHNDVYFVLI